MFVFVSFIKEQMFEIFKKIKLSVDISYFIRSVSPKFYFGAKIRSATFKMLPLMKNIFLFLSLLFFIEKFQIYQLLLTQVI